MLTFKFHISSNIRSALDDKTSLKYLCLLLEILEIYFNIQDVCVSIYGILYSYYKQPFNNT